MITPETLKTLSTITTERLATLTKRQFDGHLFLGITNGGQFAYRAHKNIGLTVQYTKVFVTPTATATIET